MSYPISAYDGLPDSPVELEPSAVAEMKKGYTAEHPTELDQQTKLEHIKATWDISDVIFDHYAPNVQESDHGRVPLVIDARAERINPFLNQTDTGLFLEFYYGNPSRLHTPWGEFRISGGGQSSGRQKAVANRAILDHLKTGVVMPGFQTTMGYVGPYLSIESVDGHALPDSRWRMRENYIDNVVAEQEWAELCAIIGRGATLLN